MPIILVYLILTYAGLSTFVQQRHRKYDNKAYPLKAELTVLGAALLVCGAALLMSVLRGSVLITGSDYSINLIVWLILIMYCLDSSFYCPRGLQLLLYPCTTVVLLLGWVFPGKFVGYQVGDLSFTLHIVSSLLTYGSSGIVTLFTVLILLLDRNLHRWRASALSNFLSPLLSLEKLIFRDMLTGSVLLTYSIVSGTFSVESMFSKSLTFVHKTTFGILSWLVYGRLLLKHSMTAWRGKKAVIWTITGFVSLLLAYVSSKFVLEIVPHRWGRRDGEAV